MEEGTLSPMEIKPCQTVSGNMLDGPKEWLNLSEEPAKSTALVCSGEEAFTRTRIVLRPWFAILGLFQWQGTLPNNLKIFPVGFAYQPLSKFNKP